MSKTMLYKAGGPHKLHGGDFDYIITEDIEGALSDGWCLSTPEALEAAKPKRVVKSPKKTGKITKAKAKKAVKKAKK